MPTAPRQDPEAQPLPAAIGTGGVAINGSATAVASADVTVTVPAPTSTAGQLRLSNDGGTTWLQRSWATSVAWSLVDPAAGGLDVDGTKEVTVETGDGIGPWSPLGSASVVLDRTGPEGVSMWFSQTTAGGPAGFGEVSGFDAGVGLARSEVSLDGIHWRRLDPSAYTFFMPGFVDLREGTIGGSWELGERLVYGRLIDRLGNVTEAPPVPVTVTSVYRPESDEVPARYEFPLPAVTGSTFTIRPVFNDGYAIPAGQHCMWTLTWGTAKVRLEAGYDETFGMTRFSVGPNKDGLCSPWTFTLPYSKTLEYSFSLAIMAGVDQSVYLTEPVSGSFRATLGTTERAITTSGLPLYYVLPDRDLVSAEGTVTYRLKAAGGAPTPVSGWWWCAPAEHESGPGGYQPQDQYGGSSFTCHVTSTGPWVAYWSRETSTRQWRAGYDPVGDRRAPVVAGVKAQVAPAAPTSTAARVRVVWTGTDRGTGLRRYQLQVSRNGGAWRSITLPTSLSAYRDVGLTFGTSYRFRVRGTDRAGNVGAWAYSTTIRPVRYDDRSAAMSYGASWTTVAGPAAIGTGRHVSSAAGASARLALDGRAVGWVAQRGPGAGFAQVYVDGALAATIDLSAPSDQPSAVVWRRTWSKRGDHVVRVRVLGTVGRPAVNIDGWVVLR